MAHLRTLRSASLAPIYLALALCASPRPGIASQVEFSNSDSVSRTGVAESKPHRSPPTPDDHLPAGDTMAIVRPGDSWSAPVVVDLDGNRSGDLGAVELELRYDPTLLRFDRITSALQHALADSHLVEPGIVRFAAAATEPQQVNPLGWIQAHFTVLPGAAAGTRASVEISLTRPPVSTSRVPYPRARTLGASVRVSP